MVSGSPMRALEPKSTVLSHAKKRHFFGQTPNRTSWTTQKAQCKNITRKRKHDEKYIRENSQKELFLEFCFAQALARPKKRKYFAQSRFPKYRYFFDVRGQKTAKIRPPPRWVRRHNQNKYPRKRNMSSGEFPKKVRFFGIFRNENCANVNFPGYS